VPSRFLCLGIFSAEFKYDARDNLFNWKSSPSPIITLVGVALIYRAIWLDVYITWRISKFTQVMVRVGYRSL